VSVSAKREARVELRTAFDGRGVDDADRKLRSFAREQAALSRASAREQARAAKKAEREARAARKEMLSTGRTVAGGVASGIGMAVGLQGMSGLADMAHDVLAYEKTLTRLRITANASHESMREFSSTVGTASLITGINRNEILSAAAAYVGLTGDMNTARASTTTWAKIAQATGSTVSDIATTAAALSQQMGIGPADMEATFAALAQQGKAGAIELKDLAGVMSQIAPMWGLFKGGKGIDGVRELGAALQVVKRGFGGDAGETVTGLQGLLVALQKNAARFKEAGIRVFDVDKKGKETMRGVFEIVDAIAKSKLVNHPDLLEKAFGRVEAYRAFLQLTQNRKALNDFVRDANDAGLIQRDFNAYVESTSGRLEKAWNAVKLAIANALTPERITRFAEVVERLTEKFETISEVLGTIADAAGFLFDAGKSIRGFLTPDDSRLAASTPEAIQLEAKAKGLSPEDAAASLQAQHGRYLAAKRAITDAMVGDKITPESNKRAVAALLSPDDQTGEGARRAGLQYISAAQLNPETIEKLSQQVRAEMIDAEIAASRGRSTRPVDEAALGAAFLHALRAGAPEIGRSVAQAISSAPPPAPNVKIGSEPLVKATRNAPVLNTRPGGRI
jgi:TP901 family phage tail tape measure protein